MRILTHPPVLPHRARPGAGTLAVDLSLGLVASTGLEPFRLWPATLAALAVILWRCARAPRAATALWHALAAGAGWFALSMSWIVEPFFVEPEIYGWMAPFALILMALGGALFWALPVWAAHRIAPGWRRRIIAIAAILALSDALRGWIFTGLPWAQIGQIWVTTPVAQAAAWVGTIGLSALTLAAAALPGLLWHQRPNAAGLVPGLAAMAALTGALWTAGLVRQARPLPPDTGVTLRIVQPDARQHLKWSPDWAAEFWRRLLELSARPGPRDLVIWPETAVNFLLNDAGPVLPEMAQAAQAPLVFGIQRAQGSRYFNSLAILDPDAQVTDIYDKFHLAPFGEYIPWGDALARIGITAFAAQQGHGYSPGPGPAILGTTAIPDFQPLICYEAIFSRHLRGLPTRPGWLLQITNDGWFGQFSGPYQHLAQTRLRAIESGLPLIRAANTGVSAVIDPHGRIRDSLPLNVMGIIDAPLPAALPPTPWTRWGDWPAIIAGLLALAAAARRRSSSL